MPYSALNRCQQMKNNAAGGFQSGSPGTGWMKRVEKAML